jgi:hypothetical protein
MSRACKCINCEHNLWFLVVPLNIDCLRIMLVLQALLLWRRCKSSCEILMRIGQSCICKQLNLCALYLQELAGVCGLSSPLIDHIANESVCMRGFLCINT